MNDPQGASFAIYTPSRGAPPSEGRPKAGEFSWHELATTDVAAAVGFYEELFGWQKTSAMDMGEMGVYQMFGVASYFDPSRLRTTLRARCPFAALMVVSSEPSGRLAYRITCG